MPYTKYVNHQNEERKMNTNSLTIVFILMTTIFLFLSIIITIITKNKFMIFEALVSFGVIIGFLGLSILNMIDGDWAKAILQLFVSFLWIRILLKGLRRSELKILIVSNEKKAFQIFIGKEESVARKLVTRTKIKGETFIVCGRDFAGKIFKAGPIKNDDLPYFLDFFLDNKKCLLCHSLLLCNFLDRIPYI